MGIQIQNGRHGDHRHFQDTFHLLPEELKSGLLLFWNTADEILQTSGIKLRQPSLEYFSITQNFFSALFLYSYFKARIPASRRIFYVAVNQCLRAMVTGCDNILDNEYKKTLDTDLPENATKFRSVLDLLVSDRVLFSLVYTLFKNNGLSSDQVMNVCAASLRTLTRSGAQEASEEGGIHVRLHPENVLTSVHHFKTGLLFKSPWAVPAVIEGLLDHETLQMTDALYQIGIGCQILDDMADLVMDIAMDRHNFVASLIVWDGRTGVSSPSDLKSRVEESKNPEDFLFAFPDIQQAAADKSLFYLQNGCRALFGKEHAFMVETAIDFLVRRIGIERFFYAA
jgi:hypothetical protein